MMCAIVGTACMVFLAESWLVLTAKSGFIDISIVRFTKHREKGNSKCSLLLFATLLMKRALKHEIAREFLPKLTR